jgi:phthalate 4,5-dioxygenase
MLQPEENERITRIGPGTPAGEFFRRYWQPAALSSELSEPDGPPIRVRLLGEDLIAFRATDGSVGLVDAFCPHRRAPLFFGRNEECGLRCVYHGWKFDASGTCVDMPSEPSDSLFKTKVQITAYPTFEAGDVVWAYLGPAAAMPPKPDYEWMRAPRTHRILSKTFEDANYLQGLEGGLDTSHSSFAHNERLGDRNWIRNRDGAPRIDVERTAYGYSYISTRDVAEDGLYVRVYHYVMPAQQMRGSITALTGERAKVPKLDGHIWVPIDDEHTYVYNWACSYSSADPITPEYAEHWESMNGRGADDLVPGTFRLKKTRANDYLIDRERQKTKTFTGIVGINTQDFALQEGMGQLADRSREHLGTSDKAIIAARQLLLESVDAVASGKKARGTDPSTYRTVRPYDDYVPKNGDWREQFATELVAKW